MDLQSIRDWVLIVVGILYSLIFFALWIAVFVLGHLINSYLGKGHDLMIQRVRPFVSDLHAQAENLRLRTLTLPGQPPLPGSESIRATLPATRSLRPLSLKIPFLGRRKSWWRRMLPS